MSGPAEIETLIAKTALGDRAAFRGLYALTSAKLFGVTLRVLKNRTEAEEALQDVYVKVWQNAGRYRSNGLSPMTWLITIARNTAIDHLRRMQTRGATSDLADTVPDIAPDPETAAIRASDHDHLQDCFGELDGAHAEAVRRAYLDGDTYAELAAHFDVPLNTMRTWLRRSLLKLRECLSR